MQYMSDIFFFSFSHPSYYFTSILLHEVMLFPTTNASLNALISLANDVQILFSSSSSIPVRSLVERERREWELSDSSLPGPDSSCKYQVVRGGEYTLYHYCIGGIVDIRVSVSTVCFHFYDLPTATIP